MIVGGDRGDLRYATAIFGRTREFQMPLVLLWAIVAARKRGWGGSAPCSSPACALARDRVVRSREDASGQRIKLPIRLLLSLIKDPE